MSRAKADLALELLGDTKEQIAETLRWLGCKGSSGVAEDCPLARYLSGAGVDSPVVGDDEIRMPYFDWHDSFIENPEHIRQFVVAFDKGVYPDLDDGQ